MKTISIFGSAQPKPNSQDYADAERVGALFAQAGYAVATGGYMGTMEAVSKGAKDAGGHVIGVTCDAIESYRPIAKNPWVMEEIRFPTLRERLLYLVTENSGSVILPGGIGTLAELAMIWNGVQCGELSPRPLVCYGSHWQETVSQFFDERYVRAEDRDLLQYGNTPDEVVGYFV